MRKGKKLLSLVLSFALLLTAMVLVVPTASAESATMAVEGYVLSVTDDGLGQGATEKKNENGLSIFYRLADGSFMVFDGGQGQKDADHLYQRLTEVAGSQNVVISVWVFTHAHADHMGVAAPFFKTYGDKVQVNEFWFNNTGDASGNGLVQNIGKYYPTTPIRKVEVDDVYNLAGIQAEILSTPEYVGAEAIDDDYNNSSLVMKLTIGSKTVLMTGDATIAVWDKLVAEKSDKLKSDILQVPHHGSTTSGTTAAYEAIDPSAIVIPAGAELKGKTINPSASNYQESTKLLYESVTTQTLAGWYNIADESTKNIQKFITSDVAIPTVKSDILDGAAVRTVEGSSGLRFISKITLAQTEAVENAIMTNNSGIQKAELGTVICRASSLSEVPVFTAEALELAGELYVDIKATEKGTHTNDNGDTYTFAALVNIKEENYKTDFAAIAYIEYTLDNGNVFRIYSDFDAETNVRNVYEVAAKALSDVKAEATVGSDEYSTIEAGSYYTNAVTQWYTYNESTGVCTKVTGQGTKYSAYKAAQIAVLEAYVTNATDNESTSNSGQVPDAWK